MEKQFTVFIETDAHWATAYVTVIYAKEDTSFDHDFGTKRQTSIVPHRVVIDQVYGPHVEINPIPDDLKDLIKKAAIEKAFDSL